jgi:HPt (histidine-containing phosphotransfer) domain-containing protein
MTTDQFELNARMQPKLAVLEVEIAAVDLSVLTQFEDAQVEGMPDVVVELIDLYLEDAPLRIVALNEALSTKDGDGIKRAAHCLRGSSGTLGAQGIALLCDEMEHMQPEDMSSKIPALLAQMAQEFERVSLTFRAERHKRSAGQNWDFKA